jgi:hypothetical protein
VSIVIQSVVVAVVVIACLAFSSWRLLSGRLRLKLLDLLAATPGAGSSGWLAALRARTLAKSPGCGGCAPATGAASPKQTPGALRR